MNHFHYIRRLASVLSGLAATVVAFVAAIPAAFATNVPPPGTDIRLPPIHTVVTGGMPGWPIALIAIGAAILAAVLTALLDRAHTRRPHTPVTAD